MILLSVIIPTRNRAELLKKTLESIVIQTFDKNSFEIIIVDNGSSDNTFEVCETFKDSFPNIRYHFEEMPGLHVGRNYGYKMATSEILVHIDDDIEAFPHWLETIYNEFQDQEVVMVGGKNLPRWESAPPEWLLQQWNKPTKYGQCITALSILDFGEERKEVHPNFIFGCNFSVRKEVLREAEGFHPDGMPRNLIHLRGDGETYVSQLVLKKGNKVIYNPRASVYHWVSISRMTPDYFSQRYFDQGISDSYTQLRNHLPLTISDSVTNRLKRFIKSLRTELSERLKNSRTPPEIDSKFIKKLCSTSYERGYLFHQRQYRRNLQLQAWVHKKNYLENNSTTSQQ